MVDEVDQDEQELVAENNENESVNTVVSTFLIDYITFLVLIL